MMQIMPTKANIESIHRLYCALTGFNLRLDMNREHVWFEYLKAGFTEPDLIMVIRHLKWCKRNGLPARSLNFHTLIQQLDWIEETLAECKARARTYRPDPDKASVMAATGRKDERVSQVRSAGDVLAGMKALDEFKKMKENL